MGLGLLGLMAGVGAGYQQGRAEKQKREQEDLRWFSPEASQEIAKAGGWHLPQGERIPKDPAWLLRSNDLNLKVSPDWTSALTPAFGGASRVTPPATVTPVVATPTPNLLNSPLPITPQTLPYTLRPGEAGVDPRALLHPAILPMAQGPGFSPIPASRVEIPAMPGGAQPNVSMPASIPSAMMSQGPSVAAPSMALTGPQVLPFGAGTKAQPPMQITRNIPEAEWDRVKGTVRQVPVPQGDLPFLSVETEYEGTSPDIFDVGEAVRLGKSAMEALGTLQERWDDHRKIGQPPTSSKVTFRNGEVIRMNPTAVDDMVKAYASKPMYREEMPMQVWNPRKPVPNGGGFGGTDIFWAPKEEAIAGNARYPADRAAALKAADDARTAARTEREAGEERSYVNPYLSTPTKLAYFPKMRKEEYPGMLAALAITYGSKANINEITARAKAEEQNAIKEYDRRVADAIKKGEYNDAVQAVKLANDLKALAYNKSPMLDEKGKQQTDLNGRPIWGEMFVLGDAATEKKFLANLADVMKGAMPHSFDKLGIKPTAAPKPTIKQMAQDAKYHDYRADIQKALQAMGWSGKPLDIANDAVYGRLASKLMVAAAEDKLPSDKAVHLVATGVAARVAWGQLTPAEQKAFLNNSDAPIPRLPAEYVLRLRAAKEWGILNYVTRD